MAAAATEQSGFQVYGVGGRSAGNTGLAAMQAEFDADNKAHGFTGASEDEDGGISLSFFDELEAIAPKEKITIALRCGDELVIVDPVMGRYIQAARHLQKVFDTAHTIDPTSSPLDILTMLLSSQHSGELVAESLDSVCNIIDVFQGDEPGTIQNKAKFDEVMEIVAAYIRVIPIKSIRYFFGQAAGAIKGQREAAKNQAKEALSE